MDHAFQKFEKKELSQDRVEHYRSTTMRRAREYQMEDPENTFWIREKLSNINVEKFEDVFLKLAHDVGANIEQGRVIGPGRTYIVDDEHMGVYSAAQHAILIGGEHIARFREKYPDTIVPIFQLLHIYAHENGHAMGYKNVFMIGETVCTDTGYESSISTQTEQLKSSATLLNEGLNDLISQYALERYLHDFPIELSNSEVLTAEKYKAFIQERFMAKDEKSRFINDHYYASRRFVAWLIGQIAEIRGKTREEITGIFVKGYFEGGEIVRKMATSLDAVVGPNFSQRVYEAHSKEELERIIVEYQPMISKKIYQERHSRIFGPPDREFKQAA